MRLPSQQSTASGASCAFVRTPHRHSCSRHAVCRAEPEEPAQLLAVDAVQSARLIFDEAGKPAVEYLTRWKADGAYTWEPSVNLSEDLVRDFEEAFWAAVKKGNLEFVSTALDHGGDVLSGIIDPDSRSALHFAAALNNRPLIERLLEAGADPNAADRDGYTPLHLAAGYLHTDAVEALLRAGADPTTRDRSGKDVPALVASLRENMASSSFMPQRLRLEEVSRLMTMHTYEDVAPAAVLASRTTDEGATQYLVRWSDGADDSWVAAEMVSDEVLADFNEGLEYAEPERLLDMRPQGEAREYLVRWRDSQAYPDSWTHEDEIPEALISQFWSGRPQDEQPANGGAGGGARPQGERSDAAPAAPTEAMAAV